MSQLELTLPGLAPRAAKPGGGRRRRERPNKPGRLRNKDGKIDYYAESADYRRKILAQQKERYRQKRKDPAWRGRENRKMRERYAAHRERYLGYRKKYQASHALESSLKGHFKRCSRAGMHLKAKFGITEEDCHKTGAIRGLLCSRCNTCLGLLEENPELLNQLIAYIHAVTNSEKFGEIKRRGVECGGC